MITKEDIAKAAEVAVTQADSEGLFVVEVKALPGEEFEVYIDSDGRVTVDDCIAVSRAIEEQFDREVDDFALTVSSAGIGQPLRVLRQYQKLVGGTAEVVLTSGVKILGTLEGADETGITLSYPEKRTVEGKKRPEIVTVSKTFAFPEIKSTKEYLDFK
jgi:ribosome maturation factor RimP